MNELPTKAIGVIRQFAVSQNGINMFCKQLIEDVQDGLINPLEIKAYFKAIEKVIEIVNESTKGSQLREADKYAENKFSLFGCDFEKAELGTKYDYSSCGDSVYRRLEKEANDSQERLKSRQAFLRALSEPITLLDEDTGEVVIVRPPSKKSTSGLKLSIK